MKKLFLLIPAFLLSVAVNAAVININTGTADALRNALSGADDGDIIEMAAGTYVESNSNFIAFTSKHVTVRAAEGAEVIIQPQVPITVSEGGCAHFQNVKIDASHLNDIQSWYEHIIYATDATANNRIVLEGCEIYNFTLNNSLIWCSSSNTLDALTINNCYFHNINKSCVFIENTSNSIAISITNSTFANITTVAGSYYAGVIDTRATSGSFLVDHCTFYNVEAMSTDYAAIGKMMLSAGAVVSNCIFALSAPGASSNRTIRDVVAANNCLVYNYTTDSNYGMQSDVSKPGCFIANPLFTNAANGDFSLAGNWVSMELSPARSAATDGSDLGDPRWYSAETLPSTDFASPYAFVGGKAVIAGNIWYDGTNDYIYYNDKSENGTATWKITATRACAIGATLNMNAGTTTGHKFKVQILDAEGNSIGEVAEASQSSASGDIALSGSIVLPAAGNYTVKLFNLTGWSSAKINSITLSYLGGAVVPVAADANTSLNVADAWFNTGATRADGTITYSSWNSADSWIKWNIATSETKFYDVSMRINTTNAHHCAVAIYEDEAADPVATVQESYSEATGDALDIEIGRVNLVGGKNYVVKVTNPVSGSAAKIVSVTFAPVAASATELPGTLAFSNAVLSANAHVTDGKLYFAPIGDTNPEGEWARWAVTTDHAGLFLFTMGVNSSNSQSYKISIYNNLDTRIDYYEAKPSSGAQTLKHYFSLPAGNYSVQVENTTEWSNGYLTSLVVTEPSVVTLDESATDNTAWADKVVDKNAAGPLYDVQIIRSFRGGMNNTFCLPFAVSSSQCKEVFGNDVEIYTLGEATIEDYILNLTVNPASDIYPGTPVLIKPSHDIVNPVFTDVQFTAYTASATTKTRANFVGSFVKTRLSASDDLLYVGPENKVFFLSVDYDMPGMRAWFVIHDVPAALGSPKALRSARIIEKEQITTSILNVETSGDAARKVLYNGQIVIIRGNEMYNMQGQHIQ